MGDKIKLEAMKIPKELKAILKNSSYFHSAEKSHVKCVMSEQHKKLGIN